MYHNIPQTTDIWALQKTNTIIKKQVCEVKLSQSSLICVTAPNPVSQPTLPIVYVLGNYIRMEYSDAYSCTLLLLYNTDAYNMLDIAWVSSHTYTERVYMIYAIKQFIIFICFAHGHHGTMVLSNVAIRGWNYYVALVAVDDLWLYVDKTSENEDIT